LTYWAVFETGERKPPAVGLICDEYTLGPFRAVIWSHSKKTWVFNPVVAAPMIFDDDLTEERREVTREQAEQIAREQFGAELPSEGELHRICEEGEKAATNP
jgi:hypothetical protein